MKNLKRKYFELWADEEAQNYILKWLLIASFAVIVIESGFLCTLAMKKPTLIALGQNDTKVLTLEKPKPELLYEELKRTVEDYVKTHYTWDFSNIESAHKAASKFVSEKFQKAFLAANADQVKEVKEKKISQTVYLSKLTDIDPSKLTAKVYMDRIFSIESLKAVVPLILEVEFEYGPRTETNPEGVYIVSEKSITETVKK